RVSLDEIEKQPFVGDVTTHAGEGARQRKVERHLTEPDAVAIEAGLFRHDQQADVLLGLYPNDELVRLGEAALALEDRMGHLPQLDEDFRLAVRQSFASSEIERHAPPPPIVDVSLQGDEGLSARRAAELIDVARDPSAAYYASAILTNDGVGCCRSLV